MKPFRAFLLGAAAYGAFLIATVPASVVARQAMDATAGKLSLADATGTLWIGSAAMELTVEEFHVAIDQVRWRFQPMRLFTGRAAFAVQARSGGLDATGELSRGLRAWEARDLRMNGDASDLAPFYAPAAVWQPAGAIALEASRLEWDGRQATGTAIAEWRDASLNLSPLRPLGSWRARAVVQGASATVNLESLRGPLRLAGNGTLALSGRFTFTGEARADPGHERELEPLLNLLGPRRADGAHALEVH